MLRESDSNRRPPGYGPGELPTALSRYNYIQPLVILGARSATWNPGVRAINKQYKINIVRAFYSWIPDTFIFASLK